MAGGALRLRDRWLLAGSAGSACVHDGARAGGLGVPVVARASGAGSPEAAQVHSRLMSFEASLRALRAPEEQLPRI
jgi:hypothetical protein